MTTELKKLTRAEVNEHNSNKSAWVIIGNKVYNVTKFLDEVWWFIFYYYYLSSI